MADASSKVPVKREEGGRSLGTLQATPFDTLRREMNRVFDDFDHGLWTSPFRRAFRDLEPLWRRDAEWSFGPSVDIVEKKEGFSLTAELPGMNEKNIEVKLANGGLSIRGEKQEDKEERGKDYHLQERKFGAFDRDFTLPEGIDSSKIEATFKNGVLTVTMPKKPEAMQAEKKIEVKAGA